MNAFIKYFKIDQAERRLFHYAIQQLFIAWWNTSFKPMSRYIKKLGVENTESEFLQLTEHEVYLSALKKSIDRASKYTPFKTKCLQQAYAGKRILNKKGIPATIYFGAAKNGEHALKAHAWLRAGTMVITGAKGRNQYTVVSKIS